MRLTIDEVAEHRKTGQGWPAGWTLLSIPAGAALGWALSLTLGQNVQHWPWIALGAVVGVALVLILWGRFRSWLSSFVRISHDPSGWLPISVRQPSRPKRKLRNETMQLVSELRVYIGNQPNPVTERMKQVLAQCRLA
jgi:hypothetical protein